MIHLFKFNESGDSNRLYSELNSEEFEKFCEENDEESSEESISKYEFNIINKAVRKSDSTNFKYEVFYSSSTYYGTETFYIHIQGRSIDGLSYRIHDNIDITKHEDGWYMVTRHRKLRRSEYKIYKCDQLNGVIKLLSDLGMVYKKYMIK